MEETAETKVAEAAWKGASVAQQQSSAAKMVMMMMMVVVVRRALSLIHSLRRTMTADDERGRGAVRR